MVLCEEPHELEFEIEVTQEDIDNGQCRSIRFCAVATAINRAMPEYSGYVNISGFDLCDDAGKVLYRGKLPETIKEWMRTFDSNWIARRKMEPFKATLNCKRKEYSNG